LMIIKCKKISSVYVRMPPAFVSTWNIAKLGDSKRQLFTPSIQVNTASVTLHRFAIYREK
jgi:hypothetical protein